VARLVVLALIASLLVIPAGAASAVTAACPAGIPSAGFTDLTGLSSSAIEAINCIKFYGVTAGTSATTYGPNDNVLRYQMALFIIRALQADGLGLPSGASQGFTDISGLTAAQQTAINQLKQLGISTGTTATTFSPNNNVLRYEMAVFMVRAAAASGVALPSGADQGFTDIGGLTAAQQTFVNQLKQLGITSGTSATTFSPFEAVPRWQMALFVAALLNVLGVVPAGLGQYTVSPNTAASLTVSSPDDATDDRVFTITGVPAGTTVDIALYPADNVTTSAGSYVFVDTDGTANEADDQCAPSAEFTVINGAATGGVCWAEVAPVGGQITATADGFGATDAVVVVWLDSNDNDDIDLNTANNPTEAFGVGGATTWNAEEGSAGLYGWAFVDGTNKDADVFTGDGFSWFYDSNDQFFIDNLDGLGEVATTMANFEAGISSDDQVHITYADSAAAVSRFSLWNSNPETLVLAAPVIGTNKVTLTWGAPAQDWDSILVQRALSTNNTDCTPTNEVWATIFTFTDQDGPYSYADTSAGAPEQYCYRLIAVNDGDQGAGSNQVFAALTAADASAPTLVSSSITTDAGLVGQLNAGEAEVYEFVFSEEMNAALTAAGLVIQLTDGDGTILNVTGTGVLDDDGGTYADNRHLTFTVTGVAVVQDGTTATFVYPGTVTAAAAVFADTSGNFLNLSTGDRTLG
jgi:hypothetical protein